MEWYVLEWSRKRNKMCVYEEEDRREEARVRGRGGGMRLKIEENVMNMIVGKRRKAESKTMEESEKGN